MLDMIPYDIDKAKDEISRELNWRAYSGKHFESIFTRFYQGYILPRKFGINKRKAHLSNLICAGAMTRDEALRDYQQENYSAELQSEDLELVLKKLRLSQDEFDAIMAAPPKKHSEFDNYRMFFRRYPLFTHLRPLWERYRNRAA